MALPEKSNNAQTGQMLKTLNRNVQQLTALVDKVLHENINLQTEVGVKLECREFDLWPLVESLIHDLHPVAGTSSTQLINHVPEDLVAYADVNLVRRVFQNLIANAIDHTAHGEIIVNAKQTDSGVECRVIDNGSGIPDDRIGLIFNKLETDAVADGRTGLGLAIVKTFVEAHNGKVTVESKIGVGTTFCFTLPKRGGKVS